MNAQYDKFLHYKTVRDAVHLDIEFDEDEIKLINTREFQRLRRIKQLGGAYLVYPSACHTRFEHVLGVCHMAQRMIDSINRIDSGRITLEDRKTIRYLALLHDIGHLPFGHTLEDERKTITEKHDGRQRLERFLVNSGISKVITAVEKELSLKDFSENLINILCSTKKGGDTKGVNKNGKLFADIVGNTICADLLDYLKRDTFFTGLQHRYDERIISSFRVTENREIFIDLTDDRSTRTGLLSEIMHLLRLRYTLGERVYYHRTKIAASAMLSKAVELLKMEVEDLCDLGDEELLFLMENTELLELRYKHIQKDVPPVSKEAAKRIVGLLRKRELFMPVVRITRAQADEKHMVKNLVECYHESQGIAKRQQLEDSICQACGLKPGQVIIYCPDKKMSGKEAEVKVRFSSMGELEVLKDVPDSSVRDEIRALEAKHNSLWSLEVFVDPDVVMEKGKRVALVFGSAHNNLTNDIGEFRSDGAEIIRYEALLEAFERSGKKDYDQVPALLKAAHKLGKDGILSCDDWITRMPDQFNPDLFTNAKKTPNPRGSK